MIAYQHQIFLQRIATPAREVLQRQLYDWIEESADQLASTPGHREAFGFGEDYKRQLSVARETVVPYRDNPRHSAGIRLSEDGHLLTVRMIPGRDRRALLAHELGHALIYNNKPLWSRISRSKLLVDPLQERLVDDVARSLLLPSAALRAHIDGTGEPYIYSARSMSSALTSLAGELNAPVRLVLARILQMISSTPSAVIYSTVPLQRELFASSEMRRTNRAQTKWVIRYTPVNDDNSGTFYPFIDFIPINKALETKGREELPVFADCHASVDLGTAEFLTRRSDVALLRRFSQFRTLALADIGDFRHLAILCS